MRKIHGVTNNKYGFLRATARSVIARFSYSRASVRLTVRLSVRPSVQ